ncbi:hypothetical protein JEQ12_006741 [Ovis aries]|uniref:Uncharacterized protein n=1 Tax=Ovis aries TaxID=9940 RepID=A0A835ZS55_SHEEP|nr:hypothetical protein JEQ12_006741 [Ovis aries]
MAFEEKPDPGFLCAKPKLPLDRARGRRVGLSTASASLLLSRRPFHPRFAQGPEVFRSESEPAESVYIVAPRKETAQRGECAQDGTAGNHQIQILVLSDGDMERDPGILRGATLRNGTNSLVRDGSASRKANSPLFMEGPLCAKPVQHTGDQEMSDPFIHFCRNPVIEQKSSVLLLPGLFAGYTG